MISRTVRYFKLMYIVAGIVMSNEKICETVDQIQIAPSVEVTEILRPKRVYRSVEKVSRSWIRRSYCFIVSRIKQRLAPLRAACNIWSIPNYLVVCSSNYISKRLVMSSDCDMIYNK